jgi:predicted ester cyclase
MGDRVALPFTARATHQGDFMGIPGSGRRFVLEGVMLWRLEGDHIADERRVYDFTGLLMKLGVLRGKPAVL